MNLGNSLFFARASEVAYLASRLDVSSPRGGLVEGQWKYLFRAEAPGEPADQRLFNLAADPTECSNLWTKERARGEAMRERYLGWLSHWDGRWTELEMLNRWNDRTQVERVLFRP